SLLCFSLIRPLPTPTLFPYTTLFRSIFPNSNSPPAAFSRLPGIFSSSQRSFRLLKYVLSGNPVCCRKRCCPPSLAKRTTSSATRSEEHTSELQSRENLVCRLLLEKKK